MMLKRLNLMNLLKDSMSLILVDLLKKFKCLDQRHLSECNGTRTHNHLVCKRTLNHSAKMASLAKRFSVCLSTK